IKNAPLSSGVDQCVATAARAPATNQARVKPIKPAAGNISACPDLQPFNTTKAALVRERVISSGLRNWSSPLAARLSAIIWYLGDCAASMKCVPKWITAGPVDMHCLTFSSDALAPSSSTGLAALCQIRAQDSISLALPTRRVRTTAGPPACVASAAQGATELSRWLRATVRARLGSAVL